MTHLDPRGEPPSSSLTHLPLSVTPVLPLTANLPGPLYPYLALPECLVPILPVLCAHLSKFTNLPSLYLFYVHLPSSTLTLLCCILSTCYLYLPLCSLTYVECTDPNLPIPCLNLPFVTRIFVILPFLTLI